MAKGSNNPRGRSSDASKPYDVSNSFVKRVASRVTELLPQPSWLSRWMSPASVPNLNDFTNHSLSSTITSRPPATSRAELNLVDNVDNHIPVKKPRTNRYNSPVNQNKFLRSNTYGPDDLSPIALPRGEPVAGPSSADPEIVASTPAVHAQPQSSTKANGDDCSETSESTSGCSSLVPQAQSSARSLGGSKYGQTYLQGANMDSLHRRKPSFSTTTFTSPLRTSMRDRVGSSPFYSGRTMYGGSSQAYLSALHSPQRRVGPTVKPLPAQQTLPLSSTAKRILDALEQFSTPVMDAKRMPVVGSKRKLESGSQRYAELSIPSTPDLLRVKRRERLQQSTSAARQAATASLASLVAQPPPPEYTVRLEDDLDRKKQTGKVKTKDKVNDEVLLEVNLPPAVLQVDNLPKIDISIPPPPPSLTVASSQPSTNSASGKFKFSTPLVVPHSDSQGTPASSQTSSFKFSAPLSETIVNKTGINKSHLSEMTRTYSDSEASNPKRQKSSSGDISVETPDSLKNDHSVVKTLSCSKTTSTGTFSAPIQNKKTLQGERQDVKFESSPGKLSSGQSKTKSSVDKGFVSKSLQKESIDKKSDQSGSKSQNNKSPNTVGFGTLYKKPVGTWECSTCLIQNKGEAIKCVACESPRPVQKVSATDLAPVSTTAPSITVVAPPTSGFGEQFKKPLGSWECQTCMVTNKSNEVKCVACETPKVSAKPNSTPKLSTVDTKPAGSGFGNMFKKAPGSWSCDTCMVTNDADKLKCVACETVKPGATLPKSEVSTPKFSFGIPASSSEGNTTFSFGIPKGQVSAPPTSSLTLPKPNEGVSEAPTSSQTFTFGIPKSSKNDADNSNESTSISSPKPMFQFSSGSTQISTPEPKLSFAVKEKMPETNKGISSSEHLKSEQTIAPNADAATSVISSVVKPNESFSGGNQLSQDKVSNNTPLFTFGANKVTQNNTVSVTEAKSSQPSFMFGAKQGGYGSNMASSTTSTLSSSSPSNVFKFGETKTVSSGSHTSSISSITTQSSIPTSKATSILSFGSNTEKKEISFGTPTPKESLASTVQTTTNENKPSFGSFSATPSPSPAFGSSNAFANSTFGSKDQTTNHFAPQTTSHVFGTTDVTSAPPSSTFTGFVQNNAFQTTTQENKPSPVFNFGSAATKEPQTTGGFVFNPVSEKRTDTTFGFAAQASAPSFGFNNTSTVPSSSFNFEPKPFGSGITSFNTTSDAPGPIFGTPVAQQPTPAFGEQSNPNQMFAFGAQSAQPTQAPSNSIFEFGNNQQQQNTPVAPAPSTTFSFGAAPAPASTPALPTPAFDPNIKPTFNFSQGGTPVFSAIPTANSGSTAQPQNRKIRKAVRRSNISSVRQT